MIEPRYAKHVELVFEPTADDIDMPAPLRNVIRRRAELGDHGRVPKRGHNRDNNVEPFGRVEQRHSKGARLMLSVRAVAADEARCRQREIKAGLFCEACKLDVVIEIPTGALFDLADNLPA